jgi:predicted ATPase
MGRRGERAIDAILASRDRGKYISPGYKKRKQSLDERIAYWLREMGLIESFSVKPIAKDSKLYEVRVRKSSKSSEVLITDVGFGVSQVLPVLVLCYYVPKGSTVLLEQPEIHLHPKVQSALADVLIDAAKNRQIQVIVESHSEHLLRRIQLRIAEEKLDAAECALYFCDVAQGESLLTSLDLDDFGNIQNWPADFFGDEFGEMAAKTKASMNRRLQGAK